MEAAAVSSSDEGTNTPQAALFRRAVVMMRVASLLFAGLTAWVLCRSRSGAGDEEDYFSSVVLRLSPLICAYLFLWTVTLSEARGALAERFMRASYLWMLAYVAARLVGPIAGMATMCLATFCSASMAWRAMAEHRLRAGTERSAAAAAESTTRYRSRAEEEHEGFIRGMAVFFMVLLAAVPCVAMAFQAGDAALSLLMFFAGPYLLITRLLLRRRGGPLDAAGSDEASMAIGGLVFGWVVVTLFVAIPFGDVGMMAVSWAGTMGMAGYLGYGLAVQRSYKQLMVIKRRQPPTVQDASGLAVGRDQEDACAAHIDRASCVSRHRATREYFYQEETGASFSDMIAQSDDEVAEFF